MTGHMTFLEDTLLGQPDMTMMEDPVEKSESLIALNLIHVTYMYMYLHVYITHCMSWYHCPIWNREHLLWLASFPINLLQSLWRQSGDWE